MDDFNKSPSAPEENNSPLSSENNSDVNGMQNAPANENEYRGASENAPFNENADRQPENFGTPERRYPDPTGSVPPYNPNNYSPDHGTNAYFPQENPNQYNYPQQNMNPYSAHNAPNGTSAQGGNVPPVYPGSPAPFAPTPAPKKSKSGNGGKAVFAIIICLCLIISSVSIGMLFTEKSNKPSQSSTQTENADEQRADNTPAASPDIDNEQIKESKPSGQELSPSQIYEAVKDINVAVIVYSQSEKAGEGSGIIVGSNDSDYTYIITCAHVISSPNVSVQVMFSDDKELDADIVGYDTKTDVGVLKVKTKAYPGAKFGNSDKIKVGQAVYAIGNPGGTEFFGSFTGGMISAIDRPVVTSSSTSYDLPCIQHNAAINPGNSGGALVDSRGYVIGLNSSKIADTEYEGMGFSVPVNTVLEVYDQLTKFGYVKDRPMLGISYYAVSTSQQYYMIAWKNNLPYGSIVIAGMTADSDLKAKGVEVGDIVTKLNGKDLTSTDILLEAIENSKVGDTLTLTICRLSNGGSVSKTFNVKVKLIEDKGTAVYEETQQPTTEAYGYDNFYWPFGY